MMILDIGLLFEPPMYTHCRVKSLYITAFCMRLQLPSLYICCCSFWQRMLPSPCYYRAVNIVCSYICHCC